MENNIKFLKNFFEKELVILSENSNINTFLLENDLSLSDVLIEEDLNNKSKNIFIINKKNKIHIVKPGETINSISLKYNKSEEEIIKNNNVNKIFVGQQLKI